MSEEIEHMHSPPPWHVEGASFLGENWFAVLHDSSMRTIVKTSDVSPVDHANAELIVKAVNEYESLKSQNAKLVEALEKIEQELEVPQPGCPQPVANAYYLAMKALYSEPL